MEKITKNCTGCRSCEQSCPKHCIKMVRDDEGFIVPRIDHNICIDCGICHKICPQNVEVYKNSPIKVYAVRNKCEKELFSSASGGAFAVLARQVLGDKNSAVVGAAYIDGDLHVGHLTIKNINELYKLQSSKYVQSDTLDSYLCAKKNLESGLKVLYSGTPCQIAGLKSFLRKEYDNLITIDLVCHGVPSPLLFEKYIAWLSCKYSKIDSYNFRDKGHGWGLNLRFKAGNISKTKPGVLDPYYYHFLKGNTYRECCYNCHYCRRERVGDLTLGDYWGIGSEHPDFYSTKGVNCLLINTKKGEYLFDSVKEALYYLESSYEKVARHNENLCHPSIRYEIRDHIYDGINEKGTHAFFKDNMAFPKSLKARISAMIPSRIMKLLRSKKK